MPQVKNVATLKLVKKIFEPTPQVSISPTEQSFV